MKDVVGCPGTWSSLALRVSQCVCAAAALVTMATARGSDTYTAYRFLLFDMVIAVLIWASASASAGVTIMLDRDTHFCEASPHQSAGYSAISGKASRGSKAAAVPHALWGFLLPQSLSNLRRNGMKDVVGRPGTGSGLTLRLSQFAFATASLVTVSNAYASGSYSAFFYLGCSMFLQLLWSFLLACIDIICLLGDAELNEPRPISALLVGDWFVGMFSFSAATASAGLTIFLKKDTQFCRAFPQLICDQYEQSVILAFVAWSFLAASALSLLWFRASL
ncbi:hypothetical protein EJB05_44522, partial [Eragrostis curvula]